MLIIDPDEQKNLVEELPLFRTAGPKPKYSETQCDFLIKTRDVPSVKFYLVASEKLKIDLATRKHKAASQMPAKFAREFKNGSGLEFDQAMLVQWSTGALDAKNEYLLENCDVRVSGWDFRGFYA